MSSVPKKRRFYRSGTTGVDQRAYPILIFSQVHEIDCAFSNRLNQPAIGASKPATVTAVPDFAICDTTGMRVRRVPHTPRRALAKLKARALR